MNDAIKAARLHLAATEAVIKEFPDASHDNDRGWTANVLNHDRVRAQLYGSFYNDAGCTVHLYVTVDLPSGDPPVRVWHRQYNSLTAYSVLDTIQNTDVATWHAITMAAIETAKSFRAKEEARETARLALIGGRS